LVLTRAYADWSQTVNAEYRGQLVGRAVDLVQLFPAAAYGKNGADIRLAVDAVEDMFRLPDLTHVVIVAGDSDYIALAQRAKRLGRYVVAVGVAGSISRSLAAACDRMVRYDALAGVAPSEAVDVSPEVVPETPSKPTRRRGAAAGRSRTTSAAAEALETETTTAEVAANEEPVVSDGPAGEASSGAASSPDERSGDAGPGAGQTETQEPAPKATKSKKLTDKQTQQRAVAGQLLQRALRLAHDKDEDAEWLDSSSVKNQLLRMDPAFNEKELGYGSFSDFASSFKFVELDTTQQVRRIRLRRR
ncbi:MAG: NYN domain-containing protein, partial [Actinobacteria bacterium]|nr:NYN domain-containing protein [Actinomycetota bacterium]